ncbi:ATP synthase F1 subunit gamma [Saccharicrinis sp. FJH62]|uniref:ATP synthase F1 subunit gamma n=1 Tax=Saccharicrinis sp. FJH62 TaxID=3344657 RepID=UPI0035D4183F
MAGLKEIRGRINTVKTTMQVTSAMKMVSAAKLKKAQNVLLSSRPYANKLEEILAHLLDDEETRTKFPYLVDEPKSDNILVIVVTSNRGLCGAFNSGLVKATLEHVRTEFPGSSTDYISIGKQGSKLLKTRGIKPIETHDELFDDLTFESLNDLSKKITSDFLNGTYDQIIFVYTKFVSAGRLDVTFENFLPVEPEEINGDTLNHDYIYEPNKEEILYDIIPKALQMHAYMVLLNSFTSEHAARMQAMQQATDNAQTLLRDLTLTYNKARQASITNEILEITGGAEALKNS